MEEIWRPVVNYEGLYEVSSLGRVRSLGFDIYHPSKFLKMRANNKKYFYVDLHKNKTAVRFLVHRLVAIAFIPNPDNLPCVNHKDCNPQNNCVENLEWVTHQQNMNYPPTRKRLSEAHKGLMLNYPGFSKPVVQYSKQWVLIATYPSASEAARQTGIKRGDIQKCASQIPQYDKRRNKYYIRPTAGGYIWRYA